MTPVAPSVAFLHTSAAHVPTFDALLSEVAPGLTGRHVVDAELLGRARAHGVDDPAVVAAVDRAVAKAAAGGLPVLCTCSTVGGLAEVRGRRRGVSVLRVDRPMAERAVAMAAAGAGRIGVVAALASTVPPTSALLEACAQDAGVAVTMVPLLCERAWPSFEAGDVDAYLDAVAQAVDEGPGDVDVVVLAQASMAPASSRVTIALPVLSSPWLGVAALVRHAEAAARRR